MQEDDDIRVIRQVPGEDFVIIGHQRVHRFFLSGLYTFNKYFNYEQAETDVFKENLKDIDTVIDVGANIGYFSLLAHSRCKQVVAFEPNEVLFRLLGANLRLNGVNNVRTSRYALFRERQSAYLKRSRGKVLALDSPTFNLKSSDLDLIRNRDDNFQPIELVPFDEIRGDLEIEKVDVAKIDVEGAEVDVLEGMRNSLMRDEPRILLSVHPTKLKPFGFSHSDVHTLLDGLHYGYEVLGDRSLSQVSVPDYEANYTLFCQSKTERVAPS